ncbi:hypothetical protein MPL3356_340031 [Mesorhizobium plurifarium]|uniref:Uncharacterized protein n=1 Tax=Mesorhizobium plurifarium TaxID=69974 RepID=A0A090E211_MESPL|nr:hypothetical protein MPL3356_340031 [Mesorhizobium plurifarium]
MEDALVNQTSQCSRIDPSAFQVRQAHDPMALNQTDGKVALRGFNGFGHVSNCLQLPVSSDILLHRSESRQAALPRSVNVARDIGASAS